MAHTKQIFTFLFLITLILSGCGQMQIEQQSNGHFHALKDKAWIKIIKEIPVPAEQARVFLQNGEVINAVNLKLYDTNCELKLNQLLPVPQQIHPGKFDIISASAEESTIVFSTPGRIRSQYAANLQLAHTPSNVKRFWRFTLKSETQPNVKHIVCRGPEDFPSNAKLPSYSEMQQSVGNYIELHLF